MLLLTSNYTKKQNHYFLERVLIPNGLAAHHDLLSVENAENGLRNKLVHFGFSLLQ